MSIILKKSPTGVQSTFLHIPKTGGMFVRDVLRKNGLINQEVLFSPTYHSTSEYTHETQHNIPFHKDDFMKSAFVFSFVRNPITWYQSYWVFKVQINRWYLSKPIDNTCRHHIFSKFIDNVITWYPNGYLTEMYSLYTKMCTNIGKQENLVSDLADFLTDMGFNDLSIDATLRVNESDGEHKKIALYRHDQIPMLIKSEFDIMKKYNYEINPEYYQNSRFVK